MHLDLIHVFNKQVFEFLHAHEIFTPQTNSLFVNLRETCIKIQKP